MFCLLFFVFSAVEIEIDIATAITSSCAPTEA
jgi:hypothetical protein